LQAERGDAGWQRQAYAAYSAHNHGAAGSFSVLGCAHTARLARQFRHD